MLVNPSLLLGMDGVPILVELSSAFGEPIAHIESFLCHFDEKGGRSFKVLSPSHCFSQDSCLSTLVAVGRNGLEREVTKVILLRAGLHSEQEENRPTGIKLWGQCSLEEDSFVLRKATRKPLQMGKEGRRLVLFIVVECGHVACLAEWLPSNELMQQL